VQPKVAASLPGSRTVALPAAFAGAAPGDLRGVPSNEAGRSAARRRDGRVSGCPLIFLSSSVPLCRNGGHDSLAVSFNGYALNDDALCHTLAPAVIQWLARRMASRAAAC
jgi:hypothetical protein